MRCRLRDIPAWNCSRHGHERVLVPVAPCQGDRAGERPISGSVPPPAPEKRTALYQPSDPNRSNGLPLTAGQPLLEEGSNWSNGFPPILPALAFAPSQPQLRILGVELRRQPQDWHFRQGDSASRSLYPTSNSRRRLARPRRHCPRKEAHQTGTSGLTRWLAVSAQICTDHGTLSSCPAAP